MKKLSTLLILSLLFINVKGQEDSTIVRWVQQLPLTDTLRWDSEILSTYDTIPVLLIITDTGTVRIPYQTLKQLPIPGSPNYVRIDMDSLSYDTMIYKPDRFDMEVVLGYQVRERFCCINGNNGVTAVYIAVPYYEHREYLDAEKERLSPSIIVWMAK